MGEHVSREARPGTVSRRAPRVDKHRTIVLIGLDGTGKSTQADNLRRHCESGGHRVKCVHHASTKVPGLSIVKRRYHGRATRALRRPPHGATSPWNGSIRAAIRRWVSRGAALYLVVGSVVKSYWYRWSARGGILLLDRCFLDDVVKVRWRLHIQSSLLTAVLKWVPVPAAVIVLDGEPEVTFTRKKAANCTFEEYLEKGRILKTTLAEAARFGWAVNHLDIRGRSEGEVFEEIIGLLERLGLTASDSGEVGHSAAGGGS